VGILELLLQLEARVNLPQPVPENTVWMDYWAGQAGVRQRWFSVSEAAGFRESRALLAGE